MVESFEFTDGKGNYYTVYENSRKIAGLREMYRLLGPAKFCELAKPILVQGSVN